MLGRDGEFSPFMEVSSMQKLLFTLMLVGSSAMAAPISCGNPGSKYHVLVGNSRTSAELTIDGKPTEFGKLTCRQDKRLACHSPHVADAGYEAIFLRHPSTGTLTVNVGEFWIGGIRHLATLPCYEAQN
jgi:hypothetical protein